MTEWRLVQLGEFFRIKHGYAFKGEFFANEGSQIVLTPGNFKEDGGLKSQGKKEKFYAADPSPDFVLERGDLLVVMTDLTQEARILGSPAFVPDDGRYLHNQRLGKVVDLETNELDQGYLYYLFNSSLVRDQLKASATGSTVRHTAPDRIYAVEALIPSLPTQRRIASILSAYDDLIVNNTRRIAILEEMARRLYEEWFVHLRFPGHEEGEFEGELPKGWLQIPLAEVCNRITDGAHKSPASVADGLPMASVKDMHSWGLDLSRCRTISEQDFCELVRNSCKPVANDILVAKDGANLNKHTFLVTEEQDVVLLSSIAILRPGNAVHPEFLVAQLKSGEVSHRIKMMRSGAAIPRIVLKDFKRLDVLVPNMDMQLLWANLAGPMHYLCRSLVKKNANLRAQRDLLLPKLISGEIDVSDLDRPIMEAAAE